MLSLCLLLSLSAVSASPVSETVKCPELAAQPDFDVSQVGGKWVSLAYMNPIPANFIASPASLSFEQRVRTSPKCVSVTNEVTESQIVMTREHHGFTAERPEASGTVVQTLNISPDDKARWTSTNNTDVHMSVVTARDKYLALVLCRGATVGMVFMLARGDAALAEQQLQQAFEQSMRDTGMQHYYLLRNTPANCPSN